MKPWTLKYKFIYVSLCWRNIALIMSDKFTRPTKLFHDAGESMNDMKKKKGFIKNHWTMCVLLVVNTLPFTGVCKWFIFLNNFTIHYYSCAQHFPGLIFASAFCEYEYIN